MRHKVTFGEFTLDTKEGLLFRGHERVHLRPQSMQVLVHLVEHQGELVPRSGLASILWVDSHVDEDLGLTAIIRNLRQVLGDSSTSPKYIETIPTKGYRFVATCPSGPTIRPALIIGTLGSLIALMLVGFLVGHTPRSSVLTLDEIPATARQVYMQGLQEYRKGNLTGSRSRFEEVVSLVPAFPDGHLLLGKSLLFSSGADLKSADQAEPHISEFLHLQPKSGGAYVALSRISIIKNLDTAKATYWAEKALELDPHDTSALDQLLEIRLILGDTTGALDYVKQIEDIDPLQVTNWVYRGWVLLFSGDYEAAASHCRVSLSVEEENSFARNCLFEAYLALDATDLARKHALDMMKIGNAPADDVRIVQNATFDEAIQRFFYWRLENVKKKVAIGGDPYPLILLYWRLGFADEAINQLKELAAERHYSSVVRFSIDSRLEVLSSNPSIRFAFNLFDENTVSVAK